jgi:S1-C subfamily serine protease
VPRGAAAGGLAVLALAAAGAMGGLAVHALDDGPARSVVAAVPEPRPAAGSGGKVDLADAVALVSPTVVQVRTDSGAQGSGVILAGSGLVVTNEHVVKGATSVRLDTDDGRTIGAVVQRVDGTQDLAVLRPEEVPGQGARLAAADDLRPGDQVFAIGSPFQLQNSVTAGVVSAVDRRDPDTGVPMIQIDAPINPGSSGGGLFDLRGRLVGIPTAILAPIRANVGIGFAVPASRVKRLVDSIP